ncbi:MAG TPA: DUF2314 domain-containing protein, partial [Kofleriaceae bacterium]|nr:DUF2314 domain-containing protein [Kofleriaceae bacterium]
ADVCHRAAAIARVGAARAGGWIVDRPTQFVFSRAKFDSARPDGFPLDGGELVAIHGVSEDEGTAFLETFGLGRFGLPELYMRHIPRSFGDDMMELVRAAEQELIERGAIEATGALDVDVARLTTPPWPQNLVALRAHGGSARLHFAATWTLGDQHAEDRPPEIELTLPGGEPAEQIHAAIAAFFGAEADTVVGAAPDDPRLMAARARARAELAALAPRFAHGVPELERLLVKAPFATDSGGVEWMWVEVHAWKGDRLSGVLVNQPDDVSSLKEGAQVEVKQGDLFDYLLHRADGTEAGGETNRILEGE